MSSIETDFVHSQNSDSKQQEAMEQVQVRNSIKPLWAFYTNQRTDLSAATDSIVLLISGYWSKTALKWSTDSENRLQ